MEKIYHFYVLSASDSPQRVRYVGTTTRSVQERLYQHRYCAKNSTKRKLPVHKWMYSKYELGLDILVTEIDSCLEEELEEKEQYWINKYSELDDLMNIDKGGKGVITKEKRNKDGLERSSEAHYKKIVLFNKEEELVEICESCKYAVKKYNLNRTSIGNVLSGRTKTVNNYYIVSFDTYSDPKFNISKHIQSLNDSNTTVKLIYKYSLDWKLLKVYLNQQEVATLENYDRSSISRAIKNKKIYKDCYWTNTKTIDFNTYEKLYKYEYNSKKFKTQKELAEYLGYEPCTISTAIRNKKMLKGHEIIVL